MITLKEIMETITIPVEVGDTILSGKFLNRKVVVKDIGKDEKGQPTINGKKLLKFRLPKLMPKTEQIQYLKNLIEKRKAKKLK